MSIYSKTISDKEILSLIPSHCKNILIVACNSCMNESLAYSKKVPLLYCNEKGEITSASYNEAKRVSDNLAQNGYISHIAVEGFCITSSDNNRISVLETSFSPDLILALSCKAGVLGLRLNTEKPVKCITTQEGYLTLTYKDINGNRIIIEELSKDIPLSQL